MSNNSRAGLNLFIKNTGVFSKIVITDEGKLRLVVTGAAGSNEITVKARIVGQDDYDLIGTIIGSSKQVLNISTYDEVQLECTTYSSTENAVKVVAASFNEAGGSTSIDGTSGTTIQDTELITFTSTDGSVSIITDDATKTVNLTSTGGVGNTKYIQSFVIGDWVGPVSGQFSIVIPNIVHAKTNPILTCFELIGSQYEQTYIPIVIEANNDIQIFTNVTFNGKIFIN